MIDTSFCLLVVGLTRNNCKRNDEVWLMENKNNVSKILVLQGSPRKKGNSTTLAQKIIEGAEVAGATVEQIYLHGQDIAPCNAC